MIDHSAEEKKNILEQPKFYVGACLVIGLSFLAIYEHDPKIITGNRVDGGEILKIKKQQRDFQKLLNDNQCYATDVVKKTVNSYGQINDGTNTNDRRNRIRILSFLKQNDQLYPMKSKTVTNGYSFRYFDHPVTYHCLEGGLSYSTMYYFKAQDFSNLSDYEKIQLAPKINEIENQKRVDQSIFDACFNGNTIVKKEICSEKNDSQ